MTGAPLAGSKYLYEDEDRHGNARLYFRRREGKKMRKVRLREKPDTTEFHEEFAAAMAGRPYSKAEPKTAPPPRIVANSLCWLIGEYYRRSPEFKAYDEETQKVRRRIFKELLNEPVVIGQPAVVGDLPCLMPEEAIIKLRDRKAETSIDSANAQVKAVRQVYKWALSVKPIKLVARNTAKAVDLLKRVDTGGHHTWTIEETLQFIRRHPPGTKAYLALMLFLLLGQRISDVRQLGKQHIRRPEHISDMLRQIHPGRWLAFRQHKNRNRNPVDLTIPILPELERVLALSPCGALSFLETAAGKPHTVKGLGNWWADRCIEAGVPGRAHGLRKAGATIAAERGATPHQMMAIFGWKKIEQAEVYTKKVRQQMMAGGAMNLIAFDYTVNECDPPQTEVGKSGSNNA